MSTDEKRELAELTTLRAAQEEKMAQAIHHVGWGVVRILSDGVVPSCHYTVGLVEKNLPEVVAFGLTMQDGLGIISDVAARLVAGYDFLANPRMDKIVADHPVYIREIEPTVAREYLLMSSNRYPKDNFRAVQMFWTDPGGYFPWEDGYDKRYFLAQPMIMPRLGT